MLILPRIHLPFPLAPLPGATRNISEPAVSLPVWTQSTAVLSRCTWMEACSRERDSAFSLLSHPGVSKMGGWHRLG